MASQPSSPGAPRHVLIAGGGVAGLEALLALAAMARGLVDVELLAPTDEFVYRPMLVAEPFGTADVLRLDLASIVAEVGGMHTHAALRAIDPAARTAWTSAGELITYDALLVAVGAKPVEAIPGVVTFGVDGDHGSFTDVLAALGREGTKRLSFVVPRSATWSIAAYELALLTAAERDARRLAGVEITLVTNESDPLALFGESASRAVAARLEAAGVKVLVASVAERFEDHRLHLAGGGSVASDAVVALPGMEVPRIPGLPQRDGGFVQTDVRMQVSGLESVWAAGDATWFPVKQGGLAAQQSNVAAASIAVAAGARVPLEAFQPVLRAALITGEAPKYMRASLSGDDGGAVAESALWWPPTKVAGRFLGPYVSRFIGEEAADELTDLAPPTDAAADEAEHQRALDLVLGAADADAASGDYEGALRWLSLLEELDLVIPSRYVSRRFEWRRRLDPGAAPDDATKRIDPSFASADAAISDLERRIGWLRTAAAGNEDEMHEQLEALDQGMDELVGLAKRAGTLKGPRPR